MNYILDTDIGPDVDDVGALFIANLYASRGMGKLLCVTHCTSDPYGVGAIRAVNKWCKAPDIPVGTLKDEGFLSDERSEKYNKALANLVTEEEREAEDATKVTRKVLAEQPDKSVTMIGIGPMRNISHLLDSKADEASNLTGRELIKQKVVKLFCMAGCFDPTFANPFSEEGEPVGFITEWNVEMDVEAASNVINNWPTPIVFGGLEVGGQVISLRDTGFLPTDSPVKLAYDLYTQGEGRMSWDLLVTERAMNPESMITTISEVGDVTIDGAGITRFKVNPEGHFQILSLAETKEEAAKHLDQLLACNDF